MDQPTAPQEPDETKSPPWTQVLPDDEPAELSGPPRTRGGDRSAQVLPWAFLAALVLIGLALLWSAGEAHYRACIEAVDVRTRGDDSALARLALQDGIDRCSRAPF